MGLKNFTQSKLSPLVFAVVRNIGPHEGFLTHQGINRENKQITNRAYNESETRTRHKHFIISYKAKETLSHGCLQVTIRTSIEKWSAREITMWKMSIIPNVLISAVMKFFLGTQEQVRNSRCKRAISVRTIEVLVYFIIIITTTTIIISF